MLWWTYRQLRSSDRETRRRALATLRSKQALAHLRRALREPHFDVRELAAEALGELGDPGAVAELARALSDVDDSVVAKAATALGKIGGAAAADALLAKERWSDLAKLGDARAVAALLRRLEKDPSYETVEALANFDDPQVVEAVVQAVASQRLGTNYDALAALLRKFGSAAMAKLARMPEDQTLTPVRRRDAACLLDRLGWKPGSKEQRVYHAIACENWDELPDQPAATTVLSGMMKWPGEYDFKVKVATALAGMPGTAALEPLVGALKSERRVDREAAAIALGVFGHRNALPALEEALRDPEESVRAKAGRSLAEIRRRQAGG